MRGKILPRYPMCLCKRIGAEDIDALGPCRCPVFSPLSGEQDIRDALVLCRLNILLVASSEKYVVHFSRSTVSVGVMNVVVAMSLFLSDIATTFLTT